MDHLFIATVNNEDRNTYIGENMAVARALPKTDFDRGDVAVVGAIKELLRCMSSEFYIPFLNNDSIQALLNFLCTN